MMANPYELETDILKQRSANPASPPGAAPVSAAPTPTYTSTEQQNYIDERLRYLDRPTPQHPRGNSNANIGALEKQLAGMRPDLMMGGFSFQPVTGFGA